MFTINSPFSIESKNAMVASLYKFFEFAEKCLQLCEYNVCIYINMCMYVCMQRSVYSRHLKQHLTPHYKIPFHMKHLSALDMCLVQNET